MILEAIASFLVGVVTHFLFMKYLPRKQESKAANQREDDFIPVGPFAIKKKSNKRRPVSHDDKSDWEREMRDAGKLV